MSPTRSRPLLVHLLNLLAAASLLAAACADSTRTSARDGSSDSVNDGAGGAAGSGGSGGSGGAGGKGGAGGGAGSGGTGGSAGAGGAGGAPADGGDATGVTCGDTTCAPGLVCCTGCDSSKTCGMACSGVPCPPVDGGTDGGDKLACGKMTCEAGDLCVEPCCGGAPPLCEPPPGDGCAAAGLVDCTQGDGTAGCMPPPCTPPAPYCIKVPDGCAAAPDCTCVTSAGADCCGFIKDRRVACVCG